MDDLDYETKFLYRVPERRLSHSKYSRRIQHGIRNDADGERTTKRVATQYENEQRRSVKRLKLKNRLLREENFKTAQKSLQKDAKIDVLDSQCEKLAREVAEVQNLDFYELLMADRMESKCPLVSYVCNECQRVFKKLTRKCREADAIELSNKRLEELVLVLGWICIIRLLWTLSTCQRRTYYSWRRFQPTKKPSSASPSSCDLQAPCSKLHSSLELECIELCIDPLELCVKETLRSIRTTCMCTTWAGCVIDCTRPRCG